MDEEFGVLATRARMNFENDLTGVRRAKPSSVRLTA